jgi:hypothetical protein
MALLTATLCGADESFPVIHYEPIMIRVLGGKDGQPIANSHLLLLGGYDQNDLHEQLYRQEAHTDGFGRVRLSKQLTNLPWLQVWVNKKPLCQASPRTDSYSVELIRRDGVSAPNRCGPATVEDAPGVLTVYVKSKSKYAPVISSRAGVPAVTLAPVAPPKATPAAEPAAQKPSLPPFTSSAPQLSAVAFAAELLTSPALVPMEETSQAAPPEQVQAAAPTVVPASEKSAITPARSKAKIPARRVAGRSVAHSVTFTAPRARPALASCQVQQPVAQAKTATARSRSKSAVASPVALIASRKPKPAAGVRRAAAHGKLKPHPQQE